MSAVRAMACSTQGKVFAAALCGSCDCCMLCAHTALLQPPSAELLFNHSPPPADGLRAALAERCTMHGHNFSAPAAQSDELRPVAAPQVCGRAGPSCRARPHSAISAAAHPAARHRESQRTALQGGQAFRPCSTTDHVIATGKTRALPKHRCIRAPKAACPMVLLLQGYFNSTDIVDELFIPTDSRPAGRSIDCR